MIGRLITLSLLAAALPAQAQTAHRLQCPAEAPAEWGLPKPAPLEQPAVLSQPVGEKIDEAAPPSLVPDKGFARGNVWHNIWAMGDEPGWDHFIDCQYRGSTRVLRLKANGLKQCEQTVQSYKSNNGVQTLTCD